MRRAAVLIDLLRRQRYLCPLNVIAAVSLLPHRPGLAVRCNRVANIIRVSCCVAGDKRLRNLIADGDVLDGLTGLLRDFREDVFQLVRLVRGQVITVRLVARPIIEVSFTPTIGILYFFWIVRIDRLICDMRAIRTVAGDTVQILIDLAAF